MTTQVLPATLKQKLSQSMPGRIENALAAVDLGNLLSIQEWDSGTITASATVEPPGGTLLVQSVEVKTSGTATSVGLYIPGNSSTTPLLPPGGAGAGVGYCAVSLDGTTITLPNTVTRVIVRYLAAPATPLSSLVDNQG